MVKGFRRLNQGWQADTTGSKLGSLRRPPSETATAAYHYWRAEAMRHRPMGGSERAKPSASYIPLELCFNLRYDFPRGPSDGEPAKSPAKILGCKLVGPRSQVVAHDVVRGRVTRPSRHIWPKHQARRHVVVNTAE